MLQPGTILDRKYRVEAVLGRGGFGHVYRARELLTGETVAVKELVSGLAEDPQAVRRFLQEARATLRLTHPHIARTYSVFQEGGTYYLAMEYLPGGSLADRLQRGPLAADQAVRVALDLCAALEYAHRSGVVHCDLKPANVLFDEAGRARLADFGIAHVSQQMMSQAVFTGTGMTMGTLRYMAPEQLEGVRDDPRLDLYALGALLYEMLAGQPYLDFEAETTPAAQMRNMARIQREAPRPLQAVNPSLPAWLVEIVERALRKAPGERFPTARALGEALQRVPSGRSTRGVAPAGPTRQPETHRRPERSRAVPASRAPGGARSAGRVPPAPKRRSGTRPILWLLAIGAGLAVLTLGALLAVQVLRPAGGTTGPVPPRVTEPVAAAVPSDTSEAPQPAPPTAVGVPASPAPLPVRAGTPLPRPAAAIAPDNAGRVIELARWGEGTVRDIAFAPAAGEGGTGSKLLAAASSLGVYLYDTATWEPVRLLATDRWQQAVAFSADGSLLACGGAEGAVQLWSVADGTLLGTLEGPLESVSRVWFSPDGAVLAAEGCLESSGGECKQREIPLWRTADRTLLQEVPIDIYLAGKASFSPDGQLLAIGATDGVQMWDVADGTLRRTLPSEVGVDAVAFSPDGGTLVVASDFQVQFWDPSTGTPLRTLDDLFWTRDLAFSPDGSLLAVAFGYGTVHIRRVSDGSELHAVEAGWAVSRVAFSADGATLATSSWWDAPVRIWSVSDGASLTTLDGHQNAVKSVAFLPDGTTVASGEWGAQVRLRRASDGSELPMAQRIWSAEQMAFSPDGSLLAVVSSGDEGPCVAEVWRVGPGQEATRLYTLGEYATGCGKVIFSPDGQWLASGAVDGSGGEVVGLWRASDGTLLHSLEPALQDITDVAFSPDGTTLAAASCAERADWDCTESRLSFWQVADRSFQYANSLDGLAMTSLAFSPDGRTVATGGTDGRIVLWRGKGPPTILEGHRAGGVRVAFSPGGTVLASGSDDGTVRLWEVETGTWLRTLPGHRGAVGSVTFSPDGLVVVSGGEDGTVRLWGVGP